MSKLIIITGASSGFGKECALQFEKKGYKCALFSRDMSKAQGLESPLFFKKDLDVRNREDFVEAVKEAESHFSQDVDCLINNAGIMPLGSFENQDPKDWDTMIDINIKGVLNGIHSVYSTMIKNKRGTIINLSSIAGKKMFDNHGVYCGTKFAVHAISDQLRKEAGAHNIRVITIAPGAAETPLLKTSNSQEVVDGYESWKKQMGGAMDPKRVVESIVFCYEMPQEVCIRELVISAINQGD